MEDSVFQIKEEVVSIPHGILVVRVPGFEWEGEVADGEEIWSTVAHSRPNIVFKTMEFVLSLVSFLSMDVFKQAGYIYLSVIMEEIPALGGNAGPSKVGNI